MLAALPGAEVPGRSTMPPNPETAGTSLCVRDVLGRDLFTSEGVVALLEVEGFGVKGFN